MSYLTIPDLAGHCVTTRVGHADLRRALPELTDTVVTEHCL